MVDIGLSRGTASAWASRGHSATEIVVLDEPATASTRRRSAHARADQAAGRKTTVMLSTYPQEVAAVCGRVIIVNRDRALDKPLSRRR
jgi:ABC-type Na+ transport system ATPase subunit NatA